MKWVETIMLVLAIISLAMGIKGNYIITLVLMHLVLILNIITMENEK